MYVSLIGFNLYEGDDEMIRVMHWLKCGSSRYLRVSIRKYMIHNQYVRNCIFAWWKFVFSENMSNPNIVQYGPT